MTKNFSPACLRNSEAIADVLTSLLEESKSLLEIGSGTGQHAVYMAKQMPHLLWQTSDVFEHHASILAWQAEVALPNALAPIQLEVGVSPWPSSQYDAVFTSNTCHIMAWQEVEMMFAGVAELLTTEGLFILYGPFNYQGQFTSASNATFDQTLKLQAPHRGIRDFEAMCELAAHHQMLLFHDVAMPANNRILVFQKNSLA